MARHASSKGKGWFSRLKQFLADVAEDVVEAIVERLLNN